MADVAGPVSAPPPVRSTSIDAQKLAEASSQVAITATVPESAAAKHAAVAATGAHLAAPGESKAASAHAAGGKDKQGGSGIVRSISNVIVELREKHQQKKRAREKEAAKKSKLQKTGLPAEHGDKVAGGRMCFSGTIGGTSEERNKLSLAQRYQAYRVHLCGSFTRWVETVPMTPVDSRPTVFQVVVHLPPGYHQYKFIVDGEWRHDETQPFMPDPLGNVNNWLFVRRPEAQPQNPGVSVISGGQLPQQAQQQSRSQVLPQHSQQQAHPQTRAGLAHPSQGPQGPPPPTLPARGQPPQQAPGQAQRPLPPPPSQLQRQSSSAQHGGVAQGQQQQQHRGSLEQSLSQPSPSHSDVDMQGVEVSAMSDDSMSAPSSLPSGMHPDEPQFTRSKIKEFLLTHTAYELIPESGKVVLLDLELPVRQAFHALHEQNVPSAPLWDAASATVAGMISASDFIHILVQLRNSVSSGASAMSEAEMDQHTLRGLRQVAEADGRPFKQLVAVQPQEDLHAFVERLCVSEVSMAPVLTTENTGQGEVCTMLHIATVSGVLGCLMRHFRASLSSLPLLSVAVGSLPVGTWAEDSRYAHEQVQPGHQPEGEERRDRRRVRRLHTVTLRTPLTTALRLLLESGCSSLPVLDETGALVNVYARSDITTLCKGNSYNRLQYEDVVVGQALQLIEATHLQPGQGSPSDHQSGPPRLHWCTARDSLRAVLERLCSSSVRRLYVVEPKTRHVEGIISLSDLATYLC